MKKVLITGVDSYVGNCFAEWIKQYPEEYEIERISVRDDKWKELDLSVYDVVLHVAGIAHRRETKENASLYYQVNRDLANEIAVKAKKEGVKQFIFLSSMSVYGLDKGVIDKDTLLKPNSHYGKSKLQAEKMLQNLAGNSFKVAIIRPPMIYGKDCKGNYQRLRKLALRTPIFPDIENKRSMIFIDNLSEFIRQIIDTDKRGVFNPQNKEYVSTSKIVKVINNVHEKKIWFSDLFNPIIKLLNLRIISKVFGDLIYDIDAFNEVEYNTISLEKSIKLTEK